MEQKTANAGGSTGSCFSWDVPKRGVLKREKSSLSPIIYIPKEIDQTVKHDVA